MIDIVNASPFVIGALTIAVLMLGVWTTSLIITDASIIDMFWGGGYALVALAVMAATLVSGFAVGTMTLAIGAVVILWGARLFTHLNIRWRKEGEEDYRYQKMRAFHGDKFWWRSFFVVFTLQGVLMFIVALPVMAAFYFGGAAALPGLSLLFLGVALFGLYMEASADIQLTKFRALENKPPLLDSGWWKYTRHPNYFGDAVFWWGIYFAVVAATPEAAWTIIGPIVMNYLLVNVSGVAMLERSLIKKPGYEEYMQRTNRFVPKIF